MKKLFGYRQIIGVIFVFSTFGLIGYLYSQNAELILENEKIKSDMSKVQQTESIPLRSPRTGSFSYGYSEFSSVSECEEEVERLKRRLSNLESDNLFQSSRSLNNSIDLSQCESEKRRLEYKVIELENEVSSLKSQLR